MIDLVLTYLREHIAAGMEVVYGVEQNHWTVGLGSLDKDPATGEDGDLRITLLHIEEERTCKAPLPYRVTGEKEGTRIEMSSPAIMLNLYVMVSAQHPKYETALKLISMVIGVFQQKKHFGDPDADDVPDAENLTAELYPMTFEQVNSLWQNLGGRRVPAVVYKVRTLKVEDPRTDRETAHIIRERTFRLYQREPKEILKIREQKNKDGKEKERPASDS